MKTTMSRTELRAAILVVLAKSRNGLYTKNVAWGIVKDSSIDCRIQLTSVRAELVRMKKDGIVVNKGNGLYTRIVTR